MNANRTFPETIAVIVALAALVVGSQTSAADKFPSKEVKVVVPWSVGGRTDVATRIWAPAVGDALGVPVIVENKPGGGGVVGANHVARSPADGYTVGVFSISHIMAQWTKIPPFELDAYVPVGLPFSSPFVLLVRANSPWQNVTEFVNDAKKKRVTFSTSGAGASIHIAAAAYAKKAGIQARYIPYKGDAGAISALLGGEVDATLMPMVAAAGQVAGGALRPLGVSLDKRDSIHANMPTFREAGIDFVFSDIGAGIFLPKGTPAPIVKKWEDALTKAFAREELRKRLKKLYVEPDFIGAQKFHKLLAETTPVLETLSQELNLVAKK
jgi:tripartite-type tricarboxylate transporter receptor subunit TctC